MSKITIGIIIGGLVTDYHRLLSYGIEKIARELNFNVIYFAGRQLESPEHFIKQGSVIFNLIDSINVDGLLICAGSISSFLSYEKLIQFIEKYKNIPMVSLSTPIQNLPYVLIDNKNGMKKLIYHLINTHKYKKIAFIRGPDQNYEAQIRFDAYREVLDEFNIKYNPELVVKGKFLYYSGKEATQILLDRNIDFEAIVASNDDMALGAIYELRKRGIVVPDDVAVVGFDDSITSKASLPSITTIKQPYLKLTESAIRMLVDLINFKKKNENKILQTELIVRRSCGCIPNSVVNARLKLDSQSHNDNTTIVDYNKFISEFHKHHRLSNFKKNFDWYNESIKVLINEINGGELDSFLFKLESILRNSNEHKQNLDDWQDFINDLRKVILLIGNNNLNLIFKAENILYQASIFINSIKEHSFYSQIFESERNTEILGFVIELLMSTMSFSQLNKVIKNEFPRLGINSTFLSLYEGNPLPSEQSKLIIAYDLDQKIQLSENGYKFPSKQLIPEKFFPKNRRFSYVIGSIHFGNEPQYGFALFELGPNIKQYMLLRYNIGSALKGIFLFKERIEAEEKLKKSEFNLKGMIKELKCLYKISRFIEKPDNSMNEIIQKTIDLIPSAWPFPDLICTRIFFDDLVFKTKNFKETEWKLSASSYINEKKMKIEVFYLENKMFTEEEINLTKDILNRLKVILEKKKAEDDLRHFIALISHELRTPITVMVQSTHIWKKYKEKMSEEKKNHLFKMMSKNVSLLDDLIDDLLIASRINEGKIKLNLDFYEPLNLINEIVELMEPKRELKKLNIKVNINRNIKLYGDKKRISQVFRIIIDNAIKYSYENSKIEINSINYYKGEYNSNGIDGVLFQFRDYGRGIDKKDLPNLFKPFFRGSNVESIPGTGLGLHIAKDLTTYHNGAIFVDSDYKSGSTFSIFLPYYK